MTRPVLDVDTDEFNVWLGWRALTLPADLPRLGWRSEHAAAWLLHDGGQLALLEPLIADPSVDADTRSKSIDELLARVRLEAERLGVRRIIAHTEYPTVVTRALRQGWKPGQQLRALHLDLAR